MIEVFSLSLLGSLATFFPVWRYWKKNLNGVSQFTNSFENSSVNEIVRIPNSLDPNFYISNGINLPEQEQLFVQSVLDNSVISSDPSLTTPPEGVRQLIENSPQFANLSFSELTNNEQLSILWRYLDNISRDQILQRGGAGGYFEGRVSQSTQNATLPASDAAPNSGGGGNFGLIIWFILSLLLLVYNGIRIYKLKEKSPRNTKN